MIMEIGDVISVEDVLLDLRPEGKTRLLKDLARHAGSRLDLPAADIVSSVSARERLGSTGLGQGVAIPHARVPGLRKSFCAFARLAEPCSFEAVDDQDVYLVAMLLLPEGSPQEQLNVLAKIARLLRDPAALAQLRSVGDATAVHRLLVAGCPPSGEAAQVRALSGS